MKLREILQDLQVLNMTADQETEIRGISYDSRKTEPGDLFVAIKGFEADGHRFIPKALEKGAAVILCEDAPGDDTPYVQIADCRYGLAVASANFFRHPAKEMKMSVLPAPAVKPVRPRSSSMCWRPSFIRRWA